MSRSLVAAALAIFVLTTLPGAADAQGVYFSRNAVLKELFRSCERVTFVELRTREHAEALRAALGYIPARATYPIFIGTRGGRIDGYAVIDEEVGEHLPITYAIKVSPNGRVERTEIMAYREAYGGEIREARFREQFVAKGLGDPIALGKDVAAITGATISARSMTRVVKRALALVGRVIATDADGKVSR